MKKRLSVLFPGLIILGISTPAASGDAADQATTGPQPGTTAGQVSGYPPAGGKGPGSGHSGPGKGSPNDQGGRGNPPSPGTAQAGPPVASVSDEPTTTDAAISSQGDPQYPGRHGLGLGYPYDGMNRDAYRSRGRGYGRGRRGHGYGYPGYRGQGGSPYPQHRQYGNPLFYPARPQE